MAAYDSEKQKIFVEEGLRHLDNQEFKKCTELGGMGKITAEKLAELGIVYAHNLIGQYMVNNMDDEATSHWLKTEIGVARDDLRATIIATMRKWCDRYL
jgi:hypothetical protein